MDHKRYVTSFCVCFTVFMILELVHAVTDEKIHRETACVGRCSYKYSLQCGRGQKIAIQDLQYGAKKVSNTCPDKPEPCQVNFETCCNYYGGDCLMSFSDDKAYSVYSNCSAAQQCGWLNAEATEMRSHCMYRGTSNYVAASYKCVDDNSFMDICSNEVYRGKSVNIIHKGEKSPNITSSKTELCSCLISTSNCDSLARLRFKTIDIRLQQINMMRKCHPHSKFFITDTGGHRNFSCQSNHIFRGYRDLYYSKPNSPYARISLYNRPGVFPSFFWFEISATLDDVDVVVSCGNAQKNTSFCGSELLPSTKIYDNYPGPTPHEDVFGGTKSQPPENLENSGDNSGDNSDLMMIIIGVVSAIVVVAAVIIVIICVRRRRKPKEKVQKTLPPIVYPPPPPYNEDSVGEYGNYYESMGTLEVCNGRHMALGENKGSFSPGPYSSAPVSPFNKPPEPPKRVIPVEPPRVDDNPYNAPWDTKPLPTPNRAKKEDLAYAASDEIQVLIKRMESDRRKLNEGSSAPTTTATQDEAPKSKFGYIHINDYKFEDMPEVERQKSNDEQDCDEHRSTDDEKSGEIDGVNMFDYNHHPLENSVTDKSEDTGYRSVGSAVETPDQILVSEDDYLIPGSARTSQRSMSKSDSNHNTDGLGSGQGGGQSEQAENDDVFKSNESKTQF